MSNRWGLMVLGCAALGACEVADLPPLPQDVTRTDTIETRDAETSTPLDTRDGGLEVDDTASVDDTLADTVDGDEDDAAEDDIDDVSAPVDGDTLADDAEPDDTTTSDDVSDTSSTPDAAACEPMIFVNPSEGQSHVASCSEVSYLANPPTSGNHYGSWPAWKVYTMPVPRGFLVHGLEHGGIVFAYNCPDGCQADIDALTAMLAARPRDARCPLGLDNQFVVTPDPLLDVRFAATAWNVSLEADCMDVAAMSAFIDAHYDQGPEKVCAQGADVSNPAITATYCPPACAWCDPPTP